MEKFDAVVLGAGSSGLTVAVGLAKAGKKILLVEKMHLGGECTNSGCIPSKALLHFAKEYYLTKKLSGSTNQHPDEALTYLKEKRAEILEEETVEALERHGLKVILGEAKFTSPNSIEVDGQGFEFKKAVIATGSNPRMIELPGVNASDILTNQNIFELETLPKQLLIIGAGPIGMELGQALAMLGTRVTIASNQSEFAHLEDPAIRPIIEKSFIDLGITIIKSANLHRIENKQALFDVVEGPQARVAFDKVLVAIGRVPNLPPDLDKASIKSESYGIVVDSQYRTSNKSVYAIGDVSQKLKFTHTAGDTGRQVVAHILSRGWLRVDNTKAVPKVTYINPEVAQVGLSEKEVLEKYKPAEYHRLEIPYSTNDRAHTDGKTNGLVIVFAKRISGQILGAHIVGARSGELISYFTLGIDEKLSLWTLRRLIFAYPTYSLLVQKVGDVFLATQLQSLKKDLIFLLKKHLPKLVALIFWSILIYQFQHYRISNDLSYGDLLFSLYEFFTMSMWGPLIYIALYAVRPLIFFPATLLTALSGALFGLWWGVIYTIVGANLSANLAYWVGRFFGSDLRLEDSFLGKYVKWLRSRPFESVLFMRLFFVPFDLANYGAGILKVKWSSYTLATLIGTIPGSTTFVAIGAAVSVMSIMENGITFDAFEPKYIIFSIVLFVVSVILSKWLQKFKAKPVT